MSKITPEMIPSFNEMMRNAESSVRIVKSNDSMDVYYIRLAEDPYIDDQNRTIFPSDSFYTELEMYFASIGIKKISYNNTRTAFWAY
jgi:hypothetical protein